MVEKKTKTSTKKEMKFRDKEIPESKIKSVKDITQLIKTNNTIVIVSIKSLPTRQFQLIKKKLRGKAVVKVVKKSAINRAIDASGNAQLEEFKKFIGEDQALMFSKVDAFELSAELSKSKSMARAKVGQLVPEDVTIEPGPTELVPGPVISELSALGLKFAIEDGKISIRDKKTILKAGQAVSEQAANIMAKLDMKPISIGIEPVAAFDIKEGKIYEDIKVNPEKVLEDLKERSSRALAFAVKIAYPVKETMSFLIGKARSHEVALEKFINVQEAN